MKPGVTGEITDGLYELERVIGTAHIIRDRASSGYGKTSYHYSGRAVEAEANQVTWLLLVQHKNLFVSLYGPFGLFRNGKPITNAGLARRYANSINVAYLGGSKTIDRVYKLPPGDAPGVGPYPPPHYVSPEVESNWRGLVRVFSRTVPAKHGAMARQAESLKGVFK